jgi:thioredoxin 1
MPAESRYLEPDEAPTREAIDATPGLLLLEFGTPACGYCRALAPRIAARLAEHSEVKHVKVEDGPGRPLGRSFQVRLWPNLVFLKDGRTLRQLARPGHAQLDEAFRELCAG